jgi:hypothetical protein
MKNLLKNLTLYATIIALTQPMQAGEVQDLLKNWGPICTATFFQACRESKSNNSVVNFFKRHDGLALGAVIGLGTYSAGKWFFNDVKLHKYRPKNLKEVSTVWGWPAAFYGAGIIAVSRNAYADNLYTRFFKRHDTAAKWTCLALCAYTLGQIGYVFYDSSYSVWGIQLVQDKDDEKIVPKKIVKKEEPKDPNQKTFDFLFTELNKQPQDVQPWADIVKKLHSELWRSEFEQFRADLLNAENSDDQLECIIPLVIHVNLFPTNLAERIKQLANKNELHGYVKLSPKEEKEAFEFLLNELNKDPKDVMAWSKIVEKLCSLLKDSSRFKKFCGDLKDTQRDGAMSIGWTLTGYSDLFPQKIQKRVTELGRGMLDYIKT